jgi:tyrosyl-tRNA synthetase
VSNSSCSPSRFQLKSAERVKKRLEGGDGMSFAEFSYALLQAWDWWELFKRGVQLQIGGADQYGNILTGVEAVKANKKVEPVHFESDQVFQGHVGHRFMAWESKAPKSGGNINEPIGFTVPLLTTSAGVKFGKSAGNAVWLDSEMTSSFDLYQFFLRTADADVERYLKLFTFLPISEIQGIMEEHRLDESKRTAQHKLAYEFVELAHGLGAAQSASKQHKQLFDPDISIDSIRADSSLAASASESTKGKARPPGDWNNSLNEYVEPTTVSNAPSVHLKLPRSLVVGQPLPKVLWSAGLVSSRGEGQRLISNKGCKIGSKTGRGADTVTMGDGLAFTAPGSGNALAEQYLIEGDLLIFKIGKWKMKIIKIVSDEEYEESGLTCPGWKDAEGDEAGREDKKAKQQEIVAFRTEKRRTRLMARERQKEQDHSVRDYRMEKD